MTEYIKNNKLSLDVLKVIKDKYEQNENIHILSLYQKNGNVTGIYLNSINAELSFLNAPHTHLQQKLPDGRIIILLELKSLLRFIYNNGSLQMLDILLYPSELDNVNKEYEKVLSFVKENVPLAIAKARLSSIIETLNSNDDNVLINIYDSIKIGKCLAKYDDNVTCDIEYHTNDNDNKSVIGMINQLNTFNQSLKNINYAKVSEKKMNELNSLCVELQKNY